MTFRLALLPAVLATLLSACGNEAPAPVAATDAPATAPAAVEDTVAEPALDPAQAAAGTAPPAGATTDSMAAPGATTSPAPAALAANDGLVEGQHYTEIAGGQPYAPLEGKVEVTEVFAYWCGACAQFDPLVAAWAAKQPADVRFTYVPAVFQDQDNFPRAFYAAEAAGIEKKWHAPLFKAVHIDRKLRQNASLDDIAAFAAGFGVPAAQFKSTMQSFAINSRLARAKQFAARSGVSGTPTLIVNGKYRVLGQSHEQALQIADGLIARERSARDDAGES